MSCGLESPDFGPLDKRPSICRAKGTSECHSAGVAVLRKTSRAFLYPFETFLLIKAHPGSSAIRSKIPEVLESAGY